MSSGSPPPVGEQLHKSGIYPGAKPRKGHVGWSSLSHCVQITVPISYFQDLADTTALRRSIRKRNGNLAGLSLRCTMDQECMQLLLVLTASFNSSGRRKMSSASRARTKRAPLYRESPNPHEFASNSVMVSDARSNVIGTLAAPQPCVALYFDLE